VRGSPNARLTWPYVPQAHARRQRPEHRREQIENQAPLKAGERDKIERTSPFVGFRARGCPTQPRDLIPPSPCGGCLRRHAFRTPCLSRLCSWQPITTKVSTHDFGEILASHGAQTRPPAPPLTVANGINGPRL
jgi:hypothetical protein